MARPSRKPCLPKLSVGMARVGLSLQALGRASLGAFRSIPRAAPHRPLPLYKEHSQYPKRPHFAIVHPFFAIVYPFSAIDYSFFAIVYLFFAIENHFSAIIRDYFAMEMAYSAIENQKNLCLYPSQNGKGARRGRGRVNHRHNAKALGYDHRPFGRKNDRQSRNTVPPVYLQRHLAGVG
jgi:hypothetical protein